MGFVGELLSRRRARRWQRWSEVEPEDDFREIGRVIVEALGDSPDLGALRTRIEALCDEHPLYPGFRGWTTYVTQ